MVSTATFRPASAAATAMAAAVVVLPTPPEPQVTTTWVAGFLTRANRFIGRLDRAHSVSALAGAPARLRHGVLMVRSRALAHLTPCAASTSANS